MASLHRISVRLPDGQKQKLMRAYQNREELTLRLAHKDLSGSDVLMVAAQVVKRLQKNKNGKKGMQIKLVRSNIRKQVGSGSPTIGSSRGGAAVRMGALPRAVLVRPPPFLGTWGKERGKKSLKLHKKIPMSNFDLLDWCQYLKILLKNVLSRDQKVAHSHKLGLFIYNLEPAYLSGSHWVATYIRDKVINYFDRFGMPPFQEMVDHAKKKNLTLLHQNSQIQNLTSSTFGYFSLYCLNEMHQGNDYFDLLRVFDADTDKNELFIEK